MRRLVLLLCPVALVASLAAWSQTARAQAIERVTIPDSLRQAHSLPASLAIGLEPPETYTRESVSGNSGRWRGPRYEDPNNPGDANFASLDWSVSFDERTGDADAAAFAHIEHREWARDQRGGLSVPHVVGTNAAGTVLGFYYLMTPAGSGDARFEAVLAFPLDINLFCIVRVEALEPSNDRYFVNGSVVASTWNRGQALLAMSGVTLDGNLPPKIVAAHSYERGRFLRGKVVDRFLGAVVGAPVSLERSFGGSWRRVAGGRTSPRGIYRFRTRVRARYRATVRVETFSATSREVRAGRK